MNIKTTILILFIAATFSAKAQNEIEEMQLNGAKPKIGLVLSGGGAKGLAHIGVLKVIDSLGIKINYIAGTSMGAIIGSLYASGYSGKELDSIFKELNFNSLINDDLPRSSIDFSERANIEKYAVKLPFNNFKIKLPSALSKGHNTYGLFLKLLLHVNNVEDFSKLPIPFLCVATNIETGKQVVLEKGNLTQSIMASGALPSLYQPVIIDNQMLVDGGVLNNYPLEELRKKGMDIVIGVDVQHGLALREKLTSAPDVLFQLNNFKTINDMVSKAKNTNIYIKPDIENYSVVSFDEGTSIIKSGELAALAKLTALKKLEYKTPIIRENMLSKLRDSIIINNTIVNGNVNYTRSYVLGKLKLKNNEKISYSDFIKGLNNLVATNNFKSFEYQLKDTPNAEGYDLIANVKETKVNTYLKFGLHYDDLYKSGALVNLTKKKLVFKNDVASLDVVLGDNVRYNFEYLIDKGFYWSVGLKSRYNQFDKNVNAQLLLDDAQITAAGLNKIGVKLRDQTNQFYLRTLLRRDFSLSLGVEHKRLEIKSETFFGNNPNEDFLFENTDYFSLFGNYKLDTYDKKYFPKKGVYFDGALNVYLKASSFVKDFQEFSIAKADLGYAFSASRKWAFNIHASGGFKFGDKSNRTLDFALGGYGNDLINNLVPFLGYDFLSLTGNSYVKASALADFEVLNKHHITLEGNWANVNDNIFDSGTWFSLPDYRGYALGYGIETFLGPIQTKYSYSPERKAGEWFFNIGFWF